MMTNEVLFLDFDGPLFSERFIKYHPLNRKPYPGRVDQNELVDYWKMDDLAVIILNELMDHHAFETVVSSSWKNFCDREQVEDLFDVNGLNLQLHEKWCTERIVRNHEFGMYHSGYGYAGKCLRASEIELWVNDHKPTDYMIIDDPWSGSSLDDRNAHGLNFNRIVLVDPQVGLSVSEIDRLRNIVRTFWSIKSTT